AWLAGMSWTAKRESVSAHTGASTHDNTRRIRGSPRSKTPAKTGRGGGICKNPFSLGGFSRATRRSPGDRAEPRHAAQREGTGGDGAGGNWEATRRCLPSHASSSGSRRDGAILALSRARSPKDPARCARSYRVKARGARFHGVTR